MCDQESWSESDGTLPPSPSSSSCSEPHLPLSSAETSWRLSCPRSLKLEYYERDDNTLEAKWRHMDFVDANYSSREERILSTVLANDDTILELNPFPYKTPRGVQHWTLWSVEEMHNDEIETFVCSWIVKNLPEAIQWNFDENLQRSIDLFHVHVYIKVPVAEADSMLPKKRARHDSEVEHTHDLAAVDCIPSCKRTKQFLTR